MIMILNKEPQATLELARKTAARLVQLGWDEAQGGNLSLTLATPPPGWEQQGKYEADVAAADGQVPGMLATASGSRWREAAQAPEHTMVYVCSNTVWTAPIAPQLKPTSELPTHGRLHALRQAQGQPAGVVLHAHPPALLALSLLPAAQCLSALELLPRLFPEAAMLLGKGIAFVSYHRPGSVELAQDTVNEFTIYEIALWHKHGVVCATENVDHALDLLETAELAARVYWRFLSVGITPEALTDQEAAELTR